MYFVGIDIGIDKITVSRAAGYNGLSQISSDYKEAEYYYIRAMHRV